jgi:hypothetical protein
LPVPAAAPTVKARFLETIEASSGPPPASPRRSWSPLVAAAALLVGLGLGFLLFGRGHLAGLPPPRTGSSADPLAAQDNEDPLLARLVALNLELAQAPAIEHQLTLLAGMAGDLRAEAIRRARQGMATDLPLLSLLHERVLRSGMLRRAQRLQPQAREQQLAFLAKQLRQAGAELEQTAQDLPPALAELLRPFGAATEATARQMLAGPSPDTGLEGEKLSTVTAGLGTSRDLVTALVAYSLLLIEEDDPLQRAWYCNEVADQFSRALLIASTQKDQDRALKLGKQIEQIVDRGVNANLSRLQATGDPRLAELNHVMERVRRALAAVDAGVRPAGPEAIPFAQVKDLEHTLKDLEKALRDLNKDKPPGKPEGHKEIRGVIKSFDAANGQLLLLVKDKGKEFDMSFTLPADARISGPGPKQRSLADLVAGARVRVLLRDPGTVGELRVD